MSFHLNQGSSTYDRNHKVCCGGKLFEAKFGAKSACCGIPKYVNYFENSPAQYDITTQFCCSDNIKSLSDVVGVPGDFSVPPNFASKVACCKDDAYYTVDHKCCNDKIVSVEDNPLAVCCRSDVIDPSKQICCNGFVYNDTESKCCGVNAYDPKTAKVISISQFPSFLSSMT